ncbi:hypothetical protein MIMGU_mgv1a021203mg [Erythranthe guttata]|uniref:3'-5' exonuclease domain-containing protein n=1 Tax=Erythranthe guttata TaxID=4155 RepID=A0A022RDK8_ERYGU|nr:PREDICTED: uncharacterized protein LOC105956476 [Erythranthe guttata]EYU38422.1 hypothetical protein MIMGU_mgv1a021203mg [Erythranthe guttata]|eukprot:XP_012835784.1 PREDICTED: uncharacterized protein LOC105956476 [Erythranthe guttata]
MKTSHHLVEFYGETIDTTVTNEASTAEHWIQSSIINWSNQHGVLNRIVGIDFKFIRHPIVSMSNKIALMQLCVGTKCLVLQLLHMDYIPQSIRDFLCDDSRTTFVGVRILENSRKLSDEYEIIVKQKVDVHFLAKRWFPLSYKGRPTLRSLANGIVGFPKRVIENRNKKGDWESRVLDNELVDQACVDVYTCYSIGHRVLTDD